MTKRQEIKLFEERKVRTVWDDVLEKWYFSIVDVVGVLTDSVDSTAYWRKLKQRLKAEGNETVTNCHALKMPAADGKMRMTNVAKAARTQLEAKLGRPVITNQKASDYLPGKTTELLEE